MRLQKIGALTALFIGALVSYRLGSAHFSTTLASAYADLGRNVLASTTAQQTFRWVRLSALPRDSGYEWKGNEVYFYGRLLPGAEPTSFMVATYQEGTSTGYTAYAKDKDRAYCYDRLAEQPFGDIPGVDLATFTPIYSHRGLADQYARDKNHIYYCNSPIPVDPTTFHLILSPGGLTAGYSADEDGAYYVDQFDFTVLKGADLQTIEYETDSAGKWDGYVRDKNHRWLNGELVPKVRSAKAP